MAVLLGIMYFTDWTRGLDLQTKLGIALNTDPEIQVSFFFQHWIHYYQTTAAGTSHPYKL